MLEYFAFGWPVAVRALATISSWPNAYANDFSLVACMQDLRARVMLGCGRRSGPQKQQPPTRRACS